MPRPPTPLFALMLLVAVAGGCRTTTLLQPALRPLPRQHVELPYTSLAGESRTLGIGYTLVGEGPDLFVMVHGLGANVDVWARALPELTRHGRVLGFDLPGCGESEAPADFPYDIPSLAAITTQMISRAGELAGRPGVKPIVFAVSLGGGIVAYSVVRLDADPAAMVLVAPAGYPMELPVFFKAIRGPLGAPLLAASTLIPGEVLGRAIYHRHEVLTPDLGAVLEAQRRDPARRAALLATFRRALDLELASTLSPRFPEIDMPTLVAWGENDPVIPTEHARLWCEALPQGRVVLFSDCGHDVQEERAELFLAEVASFLGWQMPSNALPAGAWGEQGARAPTRRLSCASPADVSPVDPAAPPP